MISEKYEDALFNLPVAKRYALEQTNPGGLEARPCLTAEWDVLCGLRNCAKLIRHVARSNRVLFKVVKQPFRGAVIDPSDRAMSLMAAVKSGLVDLDRYFPKHVFNPYIDLLARCLEKYPKIRDHADTWRFDVGPMAQATAQDLNDFVAALRQEARGSVFTGQMERLRRSCDKNTRSLRKYIDAIFQFRGSRHLVIRLDLGYAMEHLWHTERPTTVTLEGAKADFVKFQRYVRGHYPLTGFAAPLEYGLKKGFHFHALIFLNGDLVKQEVLIAKILGEQWGVITEGQGRYFNCNAQNYLKRGVGMIRHNDGDKRATLVNTVAPYLTKMDFWMRFEPGGKTFFRGQMPKAREVKTGRPRKD
jgi:hypothetical protein